MIGRPKITKTITYNRSVYNLELWNFTDDPQLPESNPFRKDFFNELSMSGDWSDSTEYQDKFNNWFDKLPKHHQRKYAQAIDESNRIIISMVWDLIISQDKAELFNNNLRQFSIWFSGLAPRDVDFYMTRVMNKQRLMPLEFNTEQGAITEDMFTSILSEVYDHIDDDLIRATTINGLLCISCMDESRLKKAKKHMIRNGNILRDYRKKENVRGQIIHTYIFSKP
jgi:hypothetical protein